MVGLVDAPDAAVAIGTVAGTQLPELFQSLSRWDLGPVCVLGMSRDCAEADVDKQHQHTIAQHPRYVTAASLHQYDDRHSHDDHPSAAVHRRAVQSIPGWSAAIDRPGSSR